MDNIAMRSIYPVVPNRTTLVSIALRSIHPVVPNRTKLVSLVNRNARVMEGYQYR